MRLHRLAALVGLIAMAWAAPQLAGGPERAVAATGSGSSAVPSAGGTWVIRTVPSVPGIRLVANGATYVSGPDGAVRVPIRAGIPFTSQIRVLDGPVRPGVRASHGRFFPRPSKRLLVAALNLSYRVNLSFSDLQGDPVAPEAITSATLKASHGKVTTLTSEQLAKANWLQGSRVVPLVGGRLRSKEIFYRVMKVMVRKANVVNRGQQKLRPQGDGSLPVQLLFYSAHFSSQDALFKTRIGSGINLQYPDGVWQSYPFDANGEVTVDKLPRGDYVVTVDAPAGPSRGRCPSRETRSWTSRS